MNVDTKKDDRGSDKATVTLPGTVEKIIPPVMPGAPEKAQIAVEGAEDLYREIRIDNTLQNESGKAVGLKRGAEVEVTIAAEPDATVPKKQPAPRESTSPSKLHDENKSS
jgi:hypothetical protein